MNILFLTTHLNTGGITSYIFTLAKGLTKRGHTVYVASSGGEYVARLAAEGIDFIPIPIKTKSEIDPRIMVSMCRLRKHIQEKNIEIIHANTRVTQVLAGLLRRFSHKTFISTCHGFFRPRFFRRALPCWGERVIAISEGVREHLFRDFKVEQERIITIHNGIDLEHFQKKISQEEARGRFGLGPGPVVGIIARLSDVKGHPFLITAMQDVTEKIPGAQLLIVGEGREKEKLADLVKRLGIGKSVYFIPSVPDTREALAAMDVFVMPSLKEGLGLSLMEAMASEVPVIGSAVGGITTLIQNRATGLLVPAGDAGRLGSAIIELLQNPAEAGAFAQAARVFIHAHFSQEEMITKTEEVYRQCLIGDSDSFFKSKTKKRVAVPNFRC
jgi:glycosyltransferase involved in cell wall biosynthesis